MQIAELIAIAKVRSGKSQKDMAADLHHTHATRISKISKGEAAANASEIIYLAKAAKMDPIRVLAEIESERHPELASVWGELVTSAALYLDASFTGPTGPTEKRRGKTRCNHSLSNRLANTKHRANRFNRVSTLYE